jgi:hypothetical protein
MCCLVAFFTCRTALQLFKLVSDSRQDDQGNGHANIGSGAKHSKALYNGHLVLSVPVLVELFLDEIDAQNFILL